MKRPTYKRRFVATEGIPGVCRADEVIIADPDNDALLISRWVEWEQYPAILARMDALTDLDRDDADPPTKRWPSPVSEPIAASSDEGALFELIYSTGGRMPEA